MPIQHGDHDSFVSFAVAFRQTVAALDRAGQPLSNYLQCRRLREATANQPAISRAVSLYFESTPRLADQRLDTMIPYIRLQLQNALPPIIGSANLTMDVSPQVSTSSPPVLSLTAVASIDAAYLAGVEAGHSQQYRRRSKPHKHCVHTPSPAATPTHSFNAWADSGASSILIAHKDAHNIPTVRPRGGHRVQVASVGSSTITPVPGLSLPVHVYPPDTLTHSLLLNKMAFVLS